MELDEQPNIEPDDDDDDDSVSPIETHDRTANQPFPLKIALEIIFVVVFILSFVARVVSSLFVASSSIVVFRFLVWWKRSREIPKTKSS